MFKKIFLSLTLLAAVFTTASAQTFPEPMKPARLVNDFAGMLTPEEQQSLEAKLADFDRNTSTQIAVITVDDLQGMDKSDYAARIFDQWGIGGKGKNNGILILVKPKTADSKGEVFISTGYGLEGVVPDALAGRIVDHDILPAFRAGQYYAGLDKAATTLMGLTQGEFTADQYLKKSQEDKGGVAGLIGAAVFFVILMIVLRSRGKQGYTVSKEGDAVAPTIFLGGMPFLMSGRHRNDDDFGGFGGFSGGGGGFGGFGGFGGGMTGGGGAGGSW